MTNTIEDITTEADVIMIVGANPEEAHPVLGMQIRRAIEEGTRLIVVDPRDIGLARLADVHLKIRPGTNVAFANGMLHVLIREGLIDSAFIEKHTEGFEALAENAAQYTPERAAEICRIDARDLIAAAKLYGAAERAAIMYCLGVTEHTTGTDGVMALSNIALACGNVGRRGCGVNPIRGQNNVQGACDMGAAPDDLPGYQKITDTEVRAKFERAWGVPLPTAPGLRSTEVLPAAAAGRVKGLFISGEDPMRTDPDTAHVARALASLDFLVVAELFLTETAKHADVVLPARSYAEKEGTFTNTERRVQRVRKAVDDPAGPMLDTEIFTEVMNRMGYAQPRKSAAEIMDEIAALTPSYGGISHARLDGPATAGRGIQWPCPAPDHPGTPILHESAPARGKAQLRATDYRPSAEKTDARYPLLMSTGRVLHHYNACAMTSRTPGIEEIGSESFIELNAADAHDLDIGDGDRVRVRSRRGRILAKARVSDKTNPGEAWMPFHFKDGNANELTIAALDDTCKVPEYKVCAVRVEKI